MSNSFINQDVMLILMKWTPKEISLLKEHYKKSLTKLPTELLKRHRSKSIYAKASKLGLKKQTPIKWTDYETKTLIKKYPILGPDIKKILKRHNRYSITKKAQKLQVTFKGRKPLKNVVITDELDELLNGLLLSDGNMSSRNEKTAFLTIHQCEQYRPWLVSLKKTFESNGVLCSEITLKRKAGIRQFPQGIYNCSNMYGFNTCFYTTFLGYFNRWYDKSKKIIPDDLRITHRILAYWFMGDGSLIERRGEAASFSLQLSTDSFKKNEVKKLGKLLQDLGYHFNINKSRTGFILVNSKKSEIIEFLTKTKPFKTDCFDYKWKALATST